MSNQKQHLRTHRQRRIRSKVKGTPKGKMPDTYKAIDVFGCNNYSGWYGEKAVYLPQLLDHIEKQHINAVPYFQPL